MRPPLPPFTEVSAIEKVRLAEDAWNSREPAKVARAYTVGASGVTELNLSKAEPRSKCF